MMNETRSNRYEKAFRVHRSAFIVGAGAPTGTL
jgi:hypothetical protein